MGRRDRRGRLESDGVLAGHYRRGRVFTTPLNSYEGLSPSDWVRDDLPDLLWPVMIAHASGDRAVELFALFQRAALDAVGPGAFAANGGLDGRVTALEAIAAEHRAAIVDVARQDEFAELFPAVVTALALLYDDLPGSWLLADPWPDPAIALEDAATDLARAIVGAAMTNNAIVKTPTLRWQVATGQMHLPPALERELLDFPNDADGRAAAEAAIRSSFLATKGVTALEVAPARNRWAESFWAQNWHRTDCWPEERDDEVGDVNADGAASDPPPPSERAVDDQTEPTNGEPDIEATADRAVDEAVRLLNYFLNAVLERALPVDLHDPSKHEVVTGLVVRSARAAIRTLHHPDLWSGEHGSTTMRILVETEIVLRWMQHSGDPDVYRKYQEYGHGKRKLMRRHFDGLLADIADPPQFLKDAAVSLENKTGGSWAEEFQDVSVEKTFANRDLRQMAADVGLDDLYRHVFQPTSGVTHGEWWAVEDYAMQRCMNPLHRFHLIPSFALEYPINPDFPKVIDGHLRACMQAALEQLAPSDEDDIEEQSTS